MAQKKDKAPLYLGLFVAVVFIISVLVFLTSKDSYNGQEINGWEVLGKQGVGFWAWVVIGFVVGAGGLYYAYKVYDGSGIGRNSTLSDGKLWLLVGVSVAIICGPWGKACTDKANAGFTLPKQAGLILLGVGKGQRNMQNIMEGDFFISPDTLDMMVDTNEMKQWYGKSVEKSVESKMTHLYCSVHGSEYCGIRSGSRNIFIGGITKQNK